eukprot:CAMPEP_0172168732 /NCGR_PEP_ID=MMETSP1050-20130122/10312_1 /TAXON_ID=233186 /ORGANISM="Cryptomonas curvata, Strain CCAP979/52" /LENGTH=92 /DNA_ID=CAMNT_0012839709 /DNA_START=76 /DNA_END=355 /DNA_ORIENTATION=-
MRSISDFACQLLAEVAAPASDAGSGDVGYSGSSGLVPQHFASNNSPVAISVMALDSGMDKVLEVISPTIVMAAARIRTAIIASSDVYNCSKT